MVHQVRLPGSSLRLSIACTGKTIERAENVPQHLKATMPSICYSCNYMDAAASEFKPGEADGRRDKISFESPSIVKLSEFKPQMFSSGPVADFSPASRRLASAASAPEFTSSFSGGVVNALASSFSRKVAFDSPSIARVSEFKPESSSTNTFGASHSSLASYDAASDGALFFSAYLLTFLACTPHSLCSVRLSARFWIFITPASISKPSIWPQPRRIIYSF